MAVDLLLSIWGAGALVVVSTLLRAYSISEKRRDKIVGLLAIIVLIFAFISIVSPYSLITH